MSHRVSFEIWGEEFRPSQIPFEFTEQHDPGVIGTLGRYRGLPTPYGSASYVVPPCIPDGEMLRYLVLTIEPILTAIRAAGATDWHIRIGRYYHEQCNEDYSLDELQGIARLGCGFTYSAYSVTEDEERELEDVKPALSTTGQSLKKLLCFLDRLERHKIWFRLERACSEALMVSVDVPGERWEIEFFANGEVEIETFRSTGEGVMGGGDAQVELRRLFIDFAD